MRRARREAPTPRFKATEDAVTTTDPELLARLNLDMLNPEQREATCHMKGPLLILAGAGSGKTRVITHRIGYLISQGVKPKSILAVSFTNKAATEMVERVANIIGKQYAKQVYLSTFHSLGNDILRQDIDALGYKKPFTILDDADQREIVKEVFRELNLDPKVVDPRAVLSIISRAKMGFCQPAELREFRFNPDTPFAQRVFKHYQSVLKGRNALDFDDLICLPVRLFKEHEEIRQRYADRFEYVMIDEYQDTNHTQLMFLHEIVKDHMNLCVVGDDDQSIYGFRGAVADNILGFEAAYEGCILIKLEQNYRSTNIILEAANAVIANNTQRKAKRLWSAKGEGDFIRWIECASERDEAEFVAAEIERLKLDLELGYESFTILYRSNAQARLFEEALRQWRIPYEVIGGQEFYDRKEVKDFIAYLKVCFNLSDENNIRRIVNLPPRGVGPVLMERISDFALVNDLSFYEAVKMISERPSCVEGIGNKVAKRLEEFITLIEHYHGRFSAMEKGAEGSMPETARELMKRLDFEDYLRSQESSNKIARRRINNLEGLLSDISSFCERHGGSLDKYLTRLMLDRSSNNDDEPKTSVRLMTFHSSKGLEFPVVFMVGVEEGYLPHENSKDSIKDISEERRLAYVGITRAKEHLYLTTAATRSRYGKAELREPSRFMDEIPEMLIAKERGEETKSLGGHQEDRNLKYLELAKKMFDF